MQNTQPVKRIFTFLLVLLAAVALFGGLVYAVLVVVHLSGPATETVYGPTTQRLWATAAVVLGLIALAIGGLVLFRPSRRFGLAPGQGGAITALVVALIAAVNGGLVLALANGGPGTGNGVVGGAAALVLGLIALPIGGLALGRSRRTSVE